MAAALRNPDWRIAAEKTGALHDLRQELIDPATETPDVVSLFAEADASVERLGARVPIAKRKCDADSETVNRLFVPDEP